MTAALTWDTVLALLNDAGRRGLTNRQIADTLGAPPERVSMLTLIMYEAAAIDRSQGEQDHNKTIVYHARSARPQTARPGI